MVSCKWFARMPNIIPSIQYSNSTFKVHNCGHVDDQWSVGVCVCVCVCRLGGRLSRAGTSAVTLQWTPSASHGAPVQVLTHTHTTTITHTMAFTPSPHSHTHTPPPSHTPPHSHHHHTHTTTGSTAKVLKKTATYQNLSTLQQIFP